MARGVKTPGSGRKKGTANKLGTLAKENIAGVFNRLGGPTAMAKWASENQTEFYKLYSRLLPVEQHGPGPEGEHAILIRHEIK